MFANISRLADALVEMRRSKAHGKAHDLRRHKNSEKVKDFFPAGEGSAGYDQVDATRYGLRLEIECFEDNHVEVSKFTGTEEIDGEYDYVQKILAKNPMN